MIIVLQSRMNLNNKIEDKDKLVIAKNILREKGNATLIKLKKDAVLREHQSMTNAMLVLLSGNAIYEEDERKETLTNSHDFLYIPQHVTHKVSATEDSLLLLIQ